jgi:hypothetical protein
MGWFTRSRPDPKPDPKPDPIADICRNLSQKPWEWSAGPNGGLQHASGIRIEWRSVPIDPSYPLTSPRRNAAVLIGDGVSVQQTREDSERIDNAIAARTAAIIARPRYTFTDAAQMLARAVQSDDEQAAYALADEVIEHAKGNRNA